MNKTAVQQRVRAPLLLKALIFLMFAMFAMTTDSVGIVIPEVIREFSLDLTSAGTFQYASMGGIGIAAIMLGFLADRFGRKRTILLGLLLYGGSSAFFAAGHTFLFFTGLLFVSGLGIGIFKAGSLALIGDISQSTREHSTTMNLVEGFFGVGAIVGPAIVAWSLGAGAGWKVIYFVAAFLCLLLVAGTALAHFPNADHRSSQSSNVGAALRLATDPTALFFGSALMLYVGAEAAIYVWAPTYLLDYEGPNAWLSAYAVSVFFVLRAAGRFFGVWLLRQLDWTSALVFCAGAMALLFWVAIAGGRGIAIYALPATGLFMSILYPTINSTGISCYEKGQHGSIAGLLLFFTCLSAVVAPLSMAILGDRLGDSTWSIALGGLFASLLTLLTLWNWLRKPFLSRLEQRNRDDYQLDGLNASGSVA